MVIGHLLDICSTIYGWSASTLDFSLISFLNCRYTGCWWYLEHEFYDFPIILGVSSSQLTFIFFREVAQPPTSTRILSCMDRGIVVSLHRLAWSLDGWILQGSCPKKGYPYRWSCFLVWLTFCGIMMFNVYSLIHLSGQWWWIVQTFQFEPVLPVALSKKISVLGCFNWTAHRLYTCIHACIHAYIHPFIHAYMHTYIHTYIHTVMFYLYTAYMHTYMYDLVLPLCMHMIS